MPKDKHAVKKKWHSSNSSYLILNSTMRKYFKVMLYSFILSNYAHLHSIISTIEASFSNDWSNNNKQKGLKESL